MNKKQSEKCVLINDFETKKFLKIEKRKRCRATPRYRYLHASRER